MGLSHSPTIITDGLVCCIDAGNPRSYPGSGTSIFDVSGRTGTGTLTNGPTFTDNYITLDGTDDSIIFPSSSSLTFGTGNFTVQIMFTISNIKGNQYLFDFGSNQFVLQNLSGTTFRYLTNSTGIRDVSYTLVANRRYEVTVVRNATTGYLYIDGQQIGTWADSENYTVNTFKIGKYGGDNNYNWQGRIYNARVYNRALSNTEIQQNYNSINKKFISAPTIPNLFPTVFDYNKTSLVYNFDAADGVSNPTRSGNVWFNSANTNANASFISTAEFRENYVYFNGANNAYAVSNASMNVDYSAGITVESIVNFEQTGSSSFWPRIIDFAVGQANENIVLTKRDTSADLRFDIYNGGTSAGIVTATNSIVYNQTKQYVAVANGTHFLLYIDGNVVSTAATTGLPLRRARASNRIGRSNWASDGAFYGYMHAVRVYNRALSNTEIQQNYLYARRTYGLL